MSGPSLIDRLKASRLVQVLIVYLGASWIVIEVADQLQEALELPSWLVPVAIVLLLVGLVVMLGTAWVQSHPATDAREATGEVPDSWEVGLGDLVGAIRRGKFPHLTWGRAILGGVFALALLFGFAGAYVLLSDRAGVGGTAELSAEEAGAGLAIVPFTTSGVDAEVFGEGMITLLGMTLDGVPELRAVDSRTVLARWDEVVGDQQRPDLAEILEVGRRAGARYVLVGSAVGTGARVQLVGDIYDTASGERLGSARAEAPADSLATLVDRLSVGATRVLLAEGGEAVHHLASLTTPSLEALLAYIEGERAYRRGSWDAALGAYERAIEQDTTFALAHLRASQVLGWTETGSPVIRQHQSAAQRFADRLPARERALLAALVGVRDSDAEQIEAAEDAVRRYPDDPDLWNALGELQVHVGQKAMRPVAEEIEALDRAVELSPDFAPYHIHVTEYWLSYGDSAAAAAAMERERALGIDTAATAFPRDHRAAFDLIHGDSARRAEARAYIEGRGAPGYLVNTLRGLRRLEAKEEFWRTLYESQPQNPRARGEYAETLVRRGRARAALDEFPRDAPNGPQVRLSLFADHGLMDADSVRGLDWGQDQGGRAFAALQLGDTAEYARARAALEEELDALYERQPGLVDDPTGPKVVLDVLDAAERWKLEGAAAAEEAMLEAYAHVPGFIVEYILPNLGELYEDMGDDRQAFERYRAAAQSIPYAALRAARLADRLGETEEARRLYRELLIAWKDADPEFQPWLEEARSWLERIPG